jgi:hypothetical protein
MVQQVVRSGRLICLVDGAAGSAIRAYNCKLCSRVGNKQASKPNEALLACLLARLIGNIYIKFWVKS